MSTQEINTTWTVRTIKQDYEFDGFLRRETAIPGTRIETVRATGLSRTEARLMADRLRQTGGRHQVMVVVIECQVMVVVIECL